MTSSLETGGRRRTLATLAAGAAAAAAAAGTYLQLKPREQPPAAPQTRGSRRFPDVELTTHEGKRVRFYTDLVKDRVVFVNMMYAQCSDRCPPMTYNLRRVQDMLGARVGHDIFMYSISLLPEHDTPADLHAYMKQHDVGPGWTFLTGAKADVERLRVALGFYDVDPKVDADIGQHTGVVRIGNDTLDRWCMAPALLDADQIVETLMAVDPVARSSGRTRVS
ncbi:MULTISPECIES: SCO family protein [Ramlibacter]|uniref:SCO family protein n=1 Tax=Ramlibacter pinisoli TaxID=2682844 RepID=A0A6N8IT55_9BURK|nr:MULTISPECIES: SCO family protein [Ramlibacter]MBA2964800.1 SCO family protein [Ramlibacter sp. CGMCC 1.13660]MVQ29765.1 SCO family protein [Ramlibacter pinisoli]